MTGKSKMKSYDPIILEEGILSFWKKNRIYEKAKEAGKKGKEFYFLDGPPYTSGKVHIGTAWNKSLKDSLLRFKRMQGLNVWDRAGYDMHGLPTEHATQKKLGIKTKEEIVAFGVGKFVGECKKLSLENLKIMSQDFQKMGVWMDFENPYMTAADTWIEAEWWLIKKAHENKRLYEGEKTLTWCAFCGTALAKHELEYKEVTDKSIFVKFPIKGKENEFLVIWTTTPWTIPFNLAVMVHPELEYVRAKVDNEVWIVAKALVNVLLSAVVGKEYKILEEFLGEKLEGTRYIHPLSKEVKQYEELEKKSPKIHTVLMSDEYVNTQSGSGLVHCAPGCGPEDYELGHRNGILPFNELDEAGVFKDTMGKYSGWTAKKDDEKFIKELEEKEVLIASTPVEHDYAHCDRCHNPVVYRTTTQWFFKTEDLIPEMQKYNKKIHWVPDWAGSRQFDSWLANLRDNGVTRQRFWGTPLPVWRCEKCGKYDVIGSVSELEKKAGKKPKDLHKPGIDKITINCECVGVKKRIPDVLDVWVDSGSASWACLDYPHRKDLFEKMFPVDFILEGKDQIRGWFNLLMVASAVSMKKPSFRSVYMHGFVQDAQGRKMSKSVGNYILPEEVISKYGADCLRYYTIGGANPAIDLNYNFNDMKVKYRNLIVLWNIHNYILDYSKNLGVNPSKIKYKSDSPEDKFILSKLNSTIEQVTSALNEYRLNETPLLVEDLYLELSRTYIQLVRDKLSTGTEEEKKNTLSILYNVFYEILRLFAPVTPLITEAMYQNLKKEFGLKEESIHLSGWPKADKRMVDKALESEFAVMELAVQGILAAREKAQLGVRWPLKEAIIVTKDKDVKKHIKKMESIIKSQTNVKDVKVEEDFEVDIVVKPDFKKIGPTYGTLSSQIVAKLIQETPKTLLKKAKEGGYKFKLGSTEVNITKDHLIVQKNAPKNYILSEQKEFDVFINTQRTTELDAEGYIREVTRRVQDMRKKAGLKKQDSIKLFLAVPKEWQVFFEKDETLAKIVGAKELKILNEKVPRKIQQEEEFKIKGVEFGVQFSVI